jgi:uncharacterized protein (TIGR00730 family)
MIKKVCVYGASSTQIDSSYKKEAFRLGEILADREIHCLYGGGSVGLMGELATAMKNNHGYITGIIPRFMVERGWGNDRVEQIIVETMHERKRLMLEDVDAAIALPGGCGTLEELLEVITWKQLGLFIKPIVILNVNGYYDPLFSMMGKAIDERFMREEHARIWNVATQADEVLPAVLSSPLWGKDAISMAAL